MLIFSHSIQIFIVFILISIFMNLILFISYLMINLVEVKKIYLIRNVFIMEQNDLNDRIIDLCMDDNPDVMKIEKCLSLILIEVRFALKDSILMEIIYYSNYQYFINIGYLIQVFVNCFEVIFQYIQSAIQFFILQ